jgi:low affinity Fe/Cu permease
MNARLRELAHRAPAMIGSPAAFAGLLFATIVWVVLGFPFGFSSGWLLVPSAIASMVALILVVLLQYSQNRDTRALQVKLDEIILAVEDARTHVLGAEHLSEEELREVERDFERLRGEVRRTG